MKSSDLADILSPFSQLANKHALSNIYKTLEVAPDSIRGCAPWGILTAFVDLDIAEPFWIDAASFIAVIKSLPNDDLSLSIKSGGLHWECGSAEGKLALVGKTEIPDADWAILGKRLYNPDKAFIQALELGSLSCGPESMSSAGVYGVIIHKTDDGLFIESSDNVTMAYCDAGLHERMAEWPEKTTLKPDAMAMLVNILKQKSEKPPRLDIQEGAIYARAGAFRLLLRPSTPLKHDILALCLNYAAREAAAKVPAESLARFVRRSAALAESKQHTFVKLKATDGALALSFAEGSATTDEYYLAKDIEGIPELPEIRLDAVRMARALTQADRMALDHIENGVLVFFCEKPAFSYLICGTQEKANG